WPEWGRIFRSSSSHEEGGGRDWGILTKKFSGEDGAVKKIHMVRLEWKEGDNGTGAKMIEISGSDFEMDADLVLLALGFLGAEKETMLKQLGVAMTPRGSVQVDKDYMTSVPGIFSCGDMRR